MAYNYLEELKSDVRNYIKEVASDYMDCEDIDELRENLYDNLWDEDSVTGNGSGSYTFNREEAKKYVADNLDLMVDAYKEFDSIEKLVNNLEDSDFETIDVTIRCYLLSQALDEVLDGEFSTFAVRELRRTVPFTQLLNRCVSYAKETGGF